MCGLTVTQCVTSSTTQSEQTKPCQMGTTMKCDHFEITTPSFSSSCSRSSCTYSFSPFTSTLHSGVASDLLLFIVLFKYLLSENGGSGLQKSTFCRILQDHTYIYIYIPPLWGNGSLAEEWVASCGVSTVCHN